MTDRRDFVALDWVKGEIDETLKQARYALEAFVDTPEDTNRLEFSLSYIHQVYGTLQMVEFFGAALLAEEMEQLNRSIVEGLVPASGENLAVLMQAIIQLPNYLDQLKKGQHDLPIIILPLLNDLRAARGASLLSETALFTPELSAAKRMVGEPDYSAFTQQQTMALLKKLRQMFQLALLGWLKNQDVDNSVGFLTKAIARIAKLTERTKIGSLWRIADAFIAGIKVGQINRSPATAKLLRDLDSELKALIADPVKVVQTYPSETLIKNLLFYIAKLEDTGVDRIAQIQRQYNLTHSLPTDQEVESQRAKLAGPDKEAISNVVTALLEELARLKDALDLMVRTKVSDPSRLKELVSPMQQLCDTMAVVGLGNPRRVLGEQITEINDTISKASEVSDLQLMDIAGALVYVEATLKGIATDESSFDSQASATQSDINNAHDALLREARNGLEQIKDAVVEFIGNHFDHARLEDATNQLTTIRGGLSMVPLHEAADILKCVQNYVEQKLIGDRYQPQWDELDALADALVGVEYYLERIFRDGSGTNVELLERAAESVRKLGYNIQFDVESNEPEVISEQDKTSNNQEAFVVDDSDTIEAPNVEDESFLQSEEDLEADLSLEFESDEEQESIDSIELNIDQNDTVIELDAKDVAATDDWDELPVADVLESDFDETLSIDQALFEAEAPQPIKADLNEVVDVESDTDHLEVSEESTENAEIIQPEVTELSEDDDDDLIDDEILEIFIEEAEEVLEAINEFFPQFKQDTSDKSALTEFRRAFHTLKGSGRMVNANLIGETAWSIESMLNRLIDGSIDISDDLLRVVEEVTAEVPNLIAQFEKKKPVDATRANALAAIADSISKGEPADWSTVSNDSEIDEIEITDSAVETLDQVDDTLEIDIETELEAEETDTSNLNFSVEVSEPSTDDNLLKIFQAELNSHIEFVDNYLSDEPIGRKLPDALQRALHTIKGSAHMASVEVIADVVQPLEALVKELQERGQKASQSFVDLLATMSILVKDFATADSTASTTPEAQSFIERVIAYKKEIFVEAEPSNTEELSLMTIFLSESMDIVMDAEHLLEAWSSQGNAEESMSVLIRELDTLAQAAYAVDLMPVSQLSNELHSLYQAAASNPYMVEEKFFNLAHDGHESLISMMDRIAAGQSIRTDALFSERLKQLYELYAIPFEVKGAQEQESETSESVESTPLDQLVDSTLAPVSTPQESNPTSSPALEVEQPERQSIEGDAELVEIFLEEANDILESIQQSLDNWTNDTANTLEVESLQRDLHTLKGGARMAEITPLGDLAHELEFLYEGLGQGKYQPSDYLISLLQQCHDRLAVMIGDIESSMSCLSAPDLIAAITLYRKDPTADFNALSALAVDSTPAETSKEPTLEDLVSQDLSTHVEHELTVEASNQESEEPANSVERVEGDSPAVALDLPDDLDFDILEIFIDEAGELLTELENAVEEWQIDNENEAHADELKRVLHTLKGGARLAKLKELGDQSHDFESFVIKTQQDKLPLNDAFFKNVMSRQDTLVSYVESLQSMLANHEGVGGGFGPSVIQLVQEMDEDEIAQLEADSESAAQLLQSTEAKDEKPLAPAEPSASDNVVAFKKKEAEPSALSKIEQPQENKRAQPQETVKVNANLLEGLVNLAGETSITRARLEQEVSDFTFSLGDMDSTIDRLRDQVRRLDLETEAQISFRQERAEETNYEDFDPLEMDRYSQIQQLSRSLMEATYDLQDIKSTLTDKTRDAETILLQQSRINTELQEGLMRTRMVPFNRLLPRLRRIVRQVSGELNKQVDFVVGNAEGEVDRTVLERMISPLEHMLRNAVDHGIEMPDARSNIGKPTKGTVQLDLAREGSDIVLKLQDDGKGIDVNRIRQKALEKGLIAEDSDLNDTEIMQFILDAGFSTAEKVTQISGRGVGMDVVNSEVKQLGGSMSIDSELGQGTQFIIRLPFTVSVNRALMVNTMDDLYALPLTSIEGIVRVTPKQLAQYYQPDAPLFEYGGGRYRLEYMASLLHTGLQPNLDNLDNNIPLVLVRGSDERHSMALHVDRLMGSREIVVKNLGPQFSKVPGVSGATILGDGSVVVILDLPALIRSELVVEDQSKATDAIEAIPVLPTSKKKEGPSKVLVCDDSVTVRKVTSRLLQRNGMDVMLAKHGGDAITQMMDEIPDLILLDIEMPHMDGFEVAQRVRHDDRLKHIPIIMITSRTGSKHRDRAISIGVNEYIGKPFQEGPLLETIERLLEES
ncbi:Hpt domain-containing protein [Reinekea marina]|uniref:histidine kinase n=1 Tax=Reinekea marina TaxID=1310421 RepID=A0ABV7WRM9_9GAMM|nr:Hpt domain-containing protein [Reinekea marina]MDN3650654.1 Hpt domain-containing protein [Reinekea marina]